MIHIEFLQSTNFFKTRTLKAGDVVFDEGEVDNNIYIIVSGKIDILKYTTDERAHTKKLATLLKMDFFGEAGLSTPDDVKQVKVVAQKDTTLLEINAQEGITEFMKSHPEEGLSFLKHIIYITNKRLNKTNKQIAADYELNREITNLEKVNLKAIFHIIDRIQAIIGCEYISFFEHNAVMDNYYQLRYDTRKTHILSDITVEIDTDRTSEIVKNIPDMDFSPFNAVVKLSVGEKKLGFLIIGRKNSIFNENENNMLISMGNSLSGIIKQKEILEEERNKSYMQENNI